MRAAQLVGSWYFCGYRPVVANETSGGRKDLSTFADLSCAKVHFPAAQFIKYMNALFSRFTCVFKALHIAKIRITV